MNERMAEELGVVELVDRRRSEGGWLVGKLINYLRI